MDVTRLVLDKENNEETETHVATIIGSYSFPEDASFDLYIRDITSLTEAASASTVISTNGTTVYKIPVRVKSGYLKNIFDEIIDHKNI